MTLLIASILQRSTRIFMVIVHSKSRVKSSMNLPTFASPYPYYLLRIGVITVLTEIKKCTNTLLVCGMETGGKQAKTAHKRQTTTPLYVTRFTGRSCEKQGFSFVEFPHVCEHVPVFWEFWKRSNFNKHIETRSPLFNGILWKLKSRQPVTCLEQKFSSDFDHFVNRHYFSQSMIAWNGLLIIISVDRVMGCYQFIPQLNAWNINASQGSWWTGRQTRAQ